MALMLKTYKIMFSSPTIKYFLQELDKFNTCFLFILRHTGMEA